MSTPLVIARLFGGLGNQLFIYAFARALAERNQVPVRFDVTGGFARDPVYRRRFLLDWLLPGIEDAGRWYSRTFPLGRSLRSLERRTNRLLPLMRRWFVQERDFAFNPDIYHLRIERTTMFNGVWQSPRYFDDLDMATLVQFPEHLTAPLAAELAPIRETNAVCLAVRRFEEVRNNRATVLPLDYFKRAMARLEDQVENPHYFVFAQDLDWARAHITSRHPVTFASGKDPYDGVIQDLYLMMQCRHFILSNSSLHWWAAWLGRSTDGLVFAPAQGWPGTDTVPGDWLRV